MGILLGGGADCKEKLLSSLGLALELTGFTLPRQGPFWNVQGLEYGHNEQVTGGTTDIPEFGKKEPEHILRSMPSPPLWFCSFKTIPKSKEEREWEKSLCITVCQVGMGSVLSVYPTPLHPMLTEPAPLV